MRNKYKSVCYVCNKMCEKGDGHIERSGRGGWQVRHFNCESQHYLKLKKQLTQSKRDNI